LPIRNLPAGLLCILVSFLASSPALAQEVKLDMDVADYPLSQLRLGRQVWGDRLSRLDFDNRVVVAYTWGITCSLSRDGIAAVNRLYEKYRDRGLVVVGFQCRRYPWIIENDLVYACHQLKPLWPVTRRGWVSPWPVSIMPWAAVFDHTGEMVFTGPLKKLEPGLVAALDAAPDYMVGGPYQELAELADTIAAGKDRVGPHMPGLRELAAGDEASAATREARTMLARIESYAANRMAKAAEQPANVVERVRIYEELAVQFEDDAIAERAIAETARILETCDFEEEESAYSTYRAAWTTFRRLPPAGRYAYSMAYTPVSDPLILARRRRMITEFRWAMLEISEWYPATYAGARAVEALTHYTAPPMSDEEADPRLETAARLLEQTDIPLRVYEGRLQVQEVIDGCVSMSGISERAIDLADKLWNKRARRIRAGANEYSSANETLDVIRGILEDRRNDVSAEDAAEYIDHLTEISKEADKDSYLATQAAPLIDALKPLAEPDFRPAKQDSAKDG